MTPEIRPVPTQADLLSRVRLRRLQDRLLDLLLARQPERNWMEPAWEGGPSLGVLNLALCEEHREKIEALVAEYECHAANA